MRGKTVVYLALIFIMAFPASASAYNVRPRQHPIPKIAVTNMVKTTSYGYACKLLKDKGFKVIEGPPTYSKSIKAWYVGVQSSYGNLKKGSTITLRRSAGPAPAYPAITGPWHTSVTSNYGGEPQGIAWDFCPWGGTTGTLDSKKVHYFAHKSMKFGTWVVFKHGKYYSVGVCVDRGPYVGNREFDFGTQLMRDLHVDGVDTVTWGYMK